MEKRLSQTLLRNQLKGKRSMEKPYKYMVNSLEGLPRYAQVIIYPRNKFEKVLSNSFERMMPTLHYFTHQLTMERYSESDWSIQERFFFSFFTPKTIYWQVFAQHFHPFMFSERSRSESFWRRTETLLPGTECPDWAKAKNRAKSQLDLQAIKNWTDAASELASEQTPSPHYNTPNYTALQHLVSSRYVGPYYGKRYFYNEKVKGDFFDNGDIDSVDREVMDSFYANDKNRAFLRYSKLDAKEREYYDKRAEHWRNKIEEFFPFMKEVDTKPLYKNQLSNPYFQRNLEDMRDNVWINNFTKLIAESYFTQEELTDLVRVLVHGNDAPFFAQCPEGNGLTATPLYEKFIKGMDIPSVFNIKKHSGKTPREQFMSAMDEHWNINYYTVSQFASQMRLQASNLNLLGADPREENHSNRLRALINEECVNPTYRRHLKALTSENEKMELTKAEEVKDRVLKEFYIADRNLRNSFIDRHHSVIAQQK